MEENMILIQKEVVISEPMWLPAKAFAVAAVNPKYFGVSPVLINQLLIKHAGWNLQNIEHFEFNEAFAATPITIANEPGIEHERINIDHVYSIGATVAILITCIVLSMHRDNLHKETASFCIGGGQAMALAIESLN
jgi:acetyl-CoA C-acetyltransferase